MERADDRTDDDSAVLSAVPRTMEATGTTAAAANEAVPGPGKTDSSRAWSPQHGTAELAQWQQSTSIGSRVMTMIAVVKASRPLMLAYVVSLRLRVCVLYLQISLTSFALCWTFSDS